MKLKFAVAILFASFVVLSVSAQSKKDLKKNKVKSVRETETTLVNGKELTADNSFYRYDSNNEVIEEIDYDSEGKVKMHNTYVYNKNGDKIDPIYFFYNDLTPEQFDLLLKKAAASNQSFD